MKRNTITTVVFLFVFFCISAADDSNQDAKQLAGTWNAISAEDAGQKLPPDQLKGMQIIFEKDQFRAIDGNEIVMKGIYTLGVSNKVATIDIKSVEGRFQGQTVEGIYKLEKAMLTICLVDPGKKRPQEFKSSKDNSAILLVFNRMKK